MTGAKEYYHIDYSISPHQDSEIDDKERVGRMEDGISQNKLLF